MPLIGRPLVAVLVVAAAVPATALAAADLERGTAAVKAAYEQTDGDDGGFGGTLVEQCRVEGESLVRCVVVDADGTRDIDTGEYSESRVPRDFGLAHFGADDQVTTSREPFAEPPVPLDPDIRVAQRLRLTRAGRLIVRVAPDVAAAVTVGASIGRWEVRRRTVSVAGDRTTAVEIRPSKAQRSRIRRALRRRPHRLHAVVYVRVAGDVGPADATETRYLNARVVR